MSVIQIDTGGAEADQRMEEMRNPQVRSSEPGADPAAENGRMSSPLTALKSIVLSMDWEISDAILTEFFQELNQLKNLFKDDSVAIKCFQLLDAIGKYILQKKAQTHPDSIRLLQTIYRDLEILLLSKGISEITRRNILADEIAQFKKLKEKLAESTKPSSGEHYEKTAGYTVPAAAEPPMMPPHEAFRYAVEEMKKVIQAEFSAIRAELELWRREK